MDEVDAREEVDSCSQELKHSSFTTEEMSPKAQYSELRLRFEVPHVKGPVILVSLSPQKSVHRLCCYHRIQT
jgi:hypothetical protein